MATDSVHKATAPSAPPAPNASDGPLAKGWARALLAILVLSALLITPGPGTAAAQSEPAAAQEFVQRINQLRASRNLGPLVVDAELTRLADEWTGVMLAQGEIFHAEDLSVGVTSNWQKLGENVGVGGTVPALHDAFVASPGHLANLVDPAYTRIGVAVRRDGNRIFTTHRFMALQGGEAPAPPTTAAPTTQAPTTQPPTTKPPVTQPPTTATPPTNPPTTNPPQPAPTAAPQPPTTQAPITVAPPTTKAPTAAAPTTTAVPAPTSAQPTPSSSPATTTTAATEPPAQARANTDDPGPPATAGPGQSQAGGQNQSESAATIQKATARSLPALLDAIGAVGPR